MSVLVLIKNRKRDILNNKHFPTNSSDLDSFFFLGAAFFSNEIKIQDRINKGHHSKQKTVLNLERCNIGSITVEQFFVQNNVLH